MKNKKLQIFYLILPAVLLSGFLFLSKEKIVFPGKSNYYSIDIILFDNVVYVPVSINKSEPVNFVLDTGAPEVSVIEKKLADNLKIKSSKKFSAGGAGSNTVSVVNLSDVGLSIEGIEFSGFRTVAFSMEHMEPYWGIPKHGLIGGNILCKLVTEINYEKKRLIFYPPSMFIDSGKGEGIPLIISDNSIMVNAGILPVNSSEFIEGKFIIDTGVRTTFFNSPFVKRNKLIEKNPVTVENITGYGIGGLGYGTLGRIRTLRIGSCRLDSPVIEFTTDEKGIAASSVFDGIIGADVLSRFSVVFDYSKKVMYLKPNSSFNDAFEYDKSGIYFITKGEDNDRFIIANIIANSAADVAGLKKGDEIISVNGASVKIYSMDTLKKLFQESGKKIFLQIKRDDSLFNFEFRLERIL